MLKKLVIIFFLIIAVGETSRSQNLTALDIIRKVDQVTWSASSRGIMTQTIITSGGEKRTFEMEIYSRDGNNNLLYRYTKPARVAGMSFLMLGGGDDIWAYFPKTDRVRHLASHVKKQKMMGSDFSYEDMGSGNIEKDYIGKLIGSEKIAGRDCYKLELIPTENGPHYSKVIMWADKETFVVHRFDYYDEKGNILKRLIQTKIKEVQGHLIPFHYEMTNLQDGGKTTIEVKKIEYDVKLDDEFFTTRNLKKR